MISNLVRCARPGDYVLCYAKGDTKIIFNACAECACVMFGNWCIAVWQHQFGLATWHTIPAMPCQVTEYMRSKGGLPVQPNHIVI
jgi:hypothetical protein